MPRVRAAAADRAIRPQASRRDRLVRGGIVSESRFLEAVASHLAEMVPLRASRLNVQDVGPTGFNLRDRANGLTLAVGFRDRAPGDRVLSVCVVLAGSRPMDRVAGLMRDYPVAPATIAERPDLAAEWVVRAAAAVRRTAHSAIDAVSRREEAERQAAEQATARHRSVDRQMEARARAEEAERAARRAQERAAAAEHERQAEAARARAREAERAARRAELVDRIRAAFVSDYLGAGEILLADPARDLLSDDEFEQLQAEFVEAWAARVGQSLDPDQARAVGAVGTDLKVTARAGSGKTRTLTTRAIFLQQHCGVSPREMLLVAFNRDAAKEMRERLVGSLGPEIPHVMTFHALAHALVHPEEDLLHDDVSAGDLNLSREIQEVIDEHIRSSSFGPRIRDLMLAHFRDDWEHIENGRFELTIDEFLNYRRNLPRETLRGEAVKSYGERVIANALFEHAVDYKYERNFRWNRTNYRPDFTISTGPDSGVVIEYFGLDGDPDYDEQSEAKRRFWHTRATWTFLEYTPADLTLRGVASFVARLLAELEDAGIPTRQRSDEEIWEEIRVRAVDRFTRAMTNFVGRARRLDLAPDALAARVDAHEPVSVAEAQFLTIGQSIYRGYLARLRANGQEDFDGLMWRAARQVRGGGARFTRDRGREQGDLAALRYVLVDEFQDFSAMFHALLDAVRAVNPAVEFMCVGDDWQAINGWAGADLAYFTDFERWFPGGRERAITTNYRSALAIVDAGNAVMDRRGPPAHAAPEAPSGRVRVGYLNAFEPTAAEMDRHERDELTPAVLRVVRHLLDEGKSVVLLARRNQVSGYVRYAERESRSVDGLARFLGHIQSFLPEEDQRRVSISTTHRYKGRERDAVVILDATEGAYPLVHPNWSFLRVFGDRLDTIVDAERRLFYVALTRAKSSLVVLTEARRRSSFLVDALRCTQFETLAWADLPPAPSLEGPRVEVRVEGYEAREFLKGLGFRFESSLRHWRRTFPVDTFQLEALTGQPWSDKCDRIVVLDEAGSVIERWAPARS